jgi:hypothetical protein
MAKRFCIVALLLASLGPAFAQPKPAVQSQVYSSWVQVGRASDISVTTSSFNEALGTLAPVAVVYNQGINWAYVAPSTTSISQVTVASGIPIPPGSCAWIGLAGQTNIAAIGTGNTTLQVALGYGVPGSCGGSAGGAASAVYGPSGVGIAANYPPVLIGGTADGTATGLMQPWRVGAGGVGFITCANCSGSGASGVDEATFSPGSPTVMAPGGGFYQTNATNNTLNNLQMGMWQFTANRAGFVNLRNAAGAEVGTNAIPLYVQGQFWQSVQPISGQVTATQGPGGNITPWTTSMPDTRPSTGTITIQDIQSSSSVGQSGVTILAGVPTVGSVYAQALNGQGTVRFSVAGIWTGTLTFEGSVDAGVTWVSQSVLVSGTSVMVSSIIADGQFLLNTSGLTNIRARATSVITGTATVTVNEGVSSSPSLSSSGATPAFSAYSKASITRLANTTTYTIDTGWNGTSPTFFTFAAACRIVGGQVLIPQIDIYSNSNPTLPLTGTLWLFSGVPATNVADNATFAIASSDFSNLTGSYAGFPFTLANKQGSVGASNSSASLTGVAYHGSCASGTTTITGMVEVTNAYIPISAEVLTVGISTVGTN